ncbi:hypothetical protein [Deinococcus depolymerans]|uniref:hypothetical protein n=1 Tax=Deinococcus depolymerans TaxID=392408 RepID=UPI0031D854FA
MPHLNLATRERLPTESVEDYIENYVKPEYEALKEAGICLGGKPLTFRRQPILQNMEAGLEHIVTEFKGKPGRQSAVIMDERCACISWIKQILENFNHCENIIWYREERKNVLDMVIILAENTDGPPFKIVLSPRSSGWLLVTAYPLRAGRLAKARQAHADFVIQLARA